MAVLLADPIPLTLGKKTDNEFVAACKFWPMLRSMGHRGISILQLAFDRAVFLPWSSASANAKPPSPTPSMAQTLGLTGNSKSCWTGRWPQDVPCTMRRTG